MIQLEQIQLDSIVGAINSRAKLDNPEFTGIPAAPTAPAGTNTTQLATTEFVLANAGVSGASLGANIFTGSQTITGANAIRGSYGGSGVISNFAAGDGALQSNTRGAYVYMTAPGIGYTPNLSFELVQLVYVSGSPATIYPSVYIDTDETGAIISYMDATNGSGFPDTTTIMTVNTIGAGTGLEFTVSSLVGGEFNTANGVSALASNTTGSSNTASGSSALSSNITGQNNTSVGASALRYNTTGSNSTAVGLEALNANTSGYDNTAVGLYAMQRNTTGYFNTAIGMAAMRNNTTGYSNTAGGMFAFASNTTGYSNTSFGDSALNMNTTANYNTAFGSNALLFNNTGYSNTAVGSAALINNTTGYSNTAIGYATGRGITTGNQNTIIGAGVSTLAPALTGNILLASGDGITKHQHNGFAWFIKQLAPAVINTTATATIVHLLTQIITSSSASAISITLPTGTLMDGALISSTNMAFDWSIINTGAGAVTTVAGVGHTIIGATGTPALTSSRWRSHRTAVGTWVTYRL